MCCPGAEGLAAGRFQGKGGANGAENEFYMTQRRKGREFKPGDAVPGTRMQREHLGTEIRWRSDYDSQGTGTEQD